MPEELVNEELVKDDGEMAFEDGIRRHLPACFTVRPPP